MKTIIFTAKTNGSKTTIKHGRKLQAKIYQRDNGECSVEMNGFQWVKCSMEEARGMVIEQTESFLEAIGAPARVVIQ